MKRIWAAMLILFLLLSFVFAGEWLIHRCMQTLQQNLNQLSQLADAQNFPVIQAAILKLTRQFRHQQPILTLFVRRDHLNALSVSIAGLSAYASPDHITDLQSEIAKIKELTFLLCPAQQRGCSEDFSVHP